MLSGSEPLRLAQLQARHAPQGFHKPGESHEILLPVQLLVAPQLGVDHRDRAADVSDFVTHRAHDDLRSGQQLLEAVLLAFTQFLGSVEHDGGKPWTGHRLVRKPDLCQKDFAILAPASALIVVRKSDTCSLSGTLASAGFRYVGMGG